MKALRPKTYSATASEAQAGQRWYVIDAEGQVLGRVATTVAQLLRGKGKPTFTPHMDGGDYVIVINAEKIVTTGDRENQKKYYRHSNYPGGLKTTVLKDLRAKHPARILEFAVRGMLPKGPLGERIYHHMKVYAGPEHPHEAQRPTPLELARDGHKRGQVTAGSFPTEAMTTAAPARRATAGRAPGAAPTAGTETIVPPSTETVVAPTMSLETEDTMVATAESMDDRPQGTAGQGE